MKRLALISALLILLASNAYSQDGEFQYYKDKDIKTLLGKDKSGGKFGSITLGYTGIDSRQTLMFGQRITWLPVHSLGIGIGVNEFISEYSHDSQLNRDIYLVGGYGGLYIEPIILPRLPVHASLPMLFGAGGVAQQFSDEDFLFSNMFEDFQTFLVFEPGVEVEMNLTKSLRLAAGLSYRFTTPFEINSSESYTFDTESLQSLTLKLTFKFGRF